MGIKDLPSEILCEIFHLLPKKTIYNCMFVCKQWYLPAKQGFYFELSISINNLLEVHSTLMEDKFNFGHWVNKLIIHHERAILNIHQTIISKFEVEEFKKLLQVLPNLTTIDLQHSINSNYYMNILCDLKRDNLLKYLEEIIPAVGTLTAKQNLLFQTYFNFRQTLTRLKINYINQFIIIDNQVGTMLSFLPKFHYLTHLSIDNNFDNQLSFIDVLNICPQLIKLEYRSKYNMEIKLSEEKKKSTLFYYTNLNSIELCVPTFTNEFMDYFIENIIPFSRINTFKLEMKRDFYYWINSEGIDKVMSFANSLRSVKNVQIYTDNLLEEQEEIQELRPTPQDKISKLFTFINAVKGNKEMQCRAVCSDSRALEVSIEITNHKKLKFSYGIYRVDLSDDRNVLTLPDKNISTIGLEILNSLSIVIIQNIEPFGPRLLKYIFKQCPQLNELRINSWNSLSKYELVGKNLLADNNNNSQLILKGPIPTQDFINLISKYLPNLNILNYKGLYNPKSHTNNKYTLNLLNFNNLIQFSFDIGYILQNVIDSKLFTLNYHHQNILNHYIIDKPPSFFDSGKNYAFHQISKDQYKSNNSTFSSNIYLQCQNIQTIHIYAKSNDPIANFYFGNLVH